MLFIVWNVSYLELYIFVDILFTYRIYQLPVLFTN